MKHRESNFVHRLNSQSLSSIYLHPINFRNIFPFARSCYFFTQAIIVPRRLFEPHFTLDLIDSSLLRGGGDRLLPSTDCLANFVDRFAEIDPQQWLNNGHFTVNAFRDSEAGRKMVAQPRASFQLN